VRVVARLRDDSHAPIVYPAARVATVDAATAAGFLAYLRGAQARAVFQRAGFTTP
jgi:molybdate transport system substrate-binding protein